MAEPRDIDVLLSEVLPYAPNCPELFAIRHIREAAAELCKRARLWRQTDEVPICATDSEALCTIEDAAIFQIEWAKLAEQDLEPVTVLWLDKHRPGWTDCTDATDAKYITQLTPNSVAVVPMVAGLLKVRYVLYPSRTAATLPDFLVEQYATEIGRGAASRILTTPGEFANPQLGLKFEADFKSLLNSLSVQAAKGQQNAPLRTEGAYF